MLIVANWKTYVETKEEAKKLFAAAKRLSLVRGVQIVVAPPAPFLGLLSPDNRSKVAFGAQDISATVVGNATGEVSATAVRNLGVRYAIIGHSERRASGETNAQVAQKAKRALSEGLIPIVCVGEQERDADARYLQALKEQLGAVFASLDAKQRLSVMIAYEPIWAIGKHAGDSITAHDLGEMVLYIRKILAAYLPEKGPAKAKVLYGGSVEPGNIEALAAGTGVDGFLVGHASVDPGLFPKLVKALA